jgi:hypothetical protein
MPRKTMVCENKDLRLVKCRRVMVDERAGADRLLGFHFSFSSWAAQSHLKRKHAMSTATHLKHSITINGKSYKSTTVTPESFSGTRPAASPAGTTEPRPSFNGLILRPEGGGPIAFVWWGGPAMDPNGIGGYRCDIPDSRTLQALFVPHPWVTEVPAELFYNITPGPAFTDSPDHAVLALGDQSPTVYLVTNGTKNGVASPAVMSYCQFQWPQQRVPQVLLDFIPDGVIINYGPQS